MTGTPGAVRPARRATIAGCVPLAAAITGLQPASGRAASTGVAGISATATDSCRFAEGPDAVLTAASGDWVVRLPCTRTTPCTLEAGSGQHFDGLGARVDSAPLAAALAPSDFTGAGASASMDTIGLALRHAASGRMLAFTWLTLRLHADSPRAR